MKYHILHFPLSLFEKHKFLKGFFKDFFKLKGNLHIVK